MTQNPTTATVSAWARLMKAQRAMLGSVEQALKQAELPPLVWYDVLLEVERAGPRGIRPLALEQAMLLAQYNLSRLIDRIERAGYVRRQACEDDAHGQNVVVTAAGREIRRRMWAVYGPAIHNVIGRHLPAKQIEALNALLGVLIDKSTAS